MRTNGRCGLGPQRPFLFPFNDRICHAPRFCRASAASRRVRRSCPRRQGFRQNRSSGPLHPKHQPSPDACLCGRDFDDRRPQTPAALRPLCALTPRDITIGRIGTFDRQRILYAGLSPAESLDPVVNEVRSTITRLGLPLDDKPFRAHITLARDWRRGHPPMTLPARTVPLSGPVLMETVKDPRTGMIRYRQVL